MTWVKLQSNYSTENAQKYIKGWSFMTFNVQLMLCFIWLHMGRHKEILNECQMSISEVAIYHHELVKKRDIPFLKILWSKSVIKNNFERYEWNK